MQQSLGTLGRDPSPVPASHLLNPAELFLADNLQNPCFYAARVSAAECECCCVLFCCSPKQTLLPKLRHVVIDGHRQVCACVHFVSTSGMWQSVVRALTAMHALVMPGDHLSLPVNNCPYPVNMCLQGTEWCL